MAIFIFTNLIAGVSGLDKSAINTANILAEEGYDTHIVNCVGKEGGFSSIKAKFALSNLVKLHALQAMAASGGKHLLKKQNLAYTVQQERLKASFTEHDLCVIREINQLLDETDLVIFTHPLQADLFSKALGGKKIRPKTILQIHGNYVEETHNRKLLLGSTECIDELQIVSESMRRDLLEITPYDNSKIRYIPNVHFPIEIKRQKSNKFNVAIIGSLQDRKNQLDALRSILKIENPEIILNVWGNHKSEYGEYLKLYVKNIEVEDRVRFRGVGTEAEIYASTDLVLITSKHEGFGYTMIEAATHSIPTIAYDYKYGANEFIVDGVNGYIVPMGDYETASLRIKELFANRDLMKSIGEEAKKAFDERFSPKSIALMYKELIPVNTKNKSKEFQDQFTRDGTSPVVHDSIKLRKKKILGMHYADSACLEIDSEKSPSFFIYKNAKKQKEVVFRRDGGKKYRATIWNMNKLPWKRPKKYLLAGEDKLGNVFYIFNTNKKSNFEIIDEFSRARPDSNTSVGYKDWPVLMARAGTSVKLDSFDVVKTVLDDDGVEIKWNPNVFNRNGNVAPHVSLIGEFDAVNIHYSSGRKFRVNPPELSYVDVFNHLIDLEKQFDLLNFEVSGIFAWELIRATVLEQIMMGFGLWGQHFTSGDKVATDYIGKKLISEAPAAKRLIFEFPRKGDIDLKTDSIRKNEDLIIEYPQRYGYSVGSYTSGNVYPIDEFWRETENLKLDGSQKYTSDFLGPVFRAEFGLDLNFKAIIEGRLLKFKKEYEFWSRIFEGRKFGEVVIPSAYWSSGICCAAKEQGSLVSDLQYALITPLHPINEFSGKTAYTPDKIYIWSKYWSEYSKKYNTKEVVKRSIILSDKVIRRFDYCVVSQPRVKKRIEKFLLKLSEIKKDQRIVYCLHPDDAMMDKPLTVAGKTLTNVECVKGNTLDYVSASNIVVGGYSTSLYEAAYLGKPVYVVKVPGWEVVSHAIDQGIFRIAESPEDLIDFHQLPVAKKIF